MKNIFYKDSGFYTAYLSLVCLAYALLLFFTKAESFLMINQFHSAGLDTFFQYVTHLGDGLFYAAIVIVLFFFNRWYGWMGVLAFALSSGLAQLLKNLFYSGEPRPLAFLKDKTLIHMIDGVEVHMLNSFPSGHTTTAFSIAVLLTYVVKNKYYPYLFLCLAAIVGYSRIYLAQHFLIDVTVGSIIGVSTAVLSIWLVDQWKNKKSL
jgi:membrane-associated phospholipid phosphatase